MEDLEEPLAALDMIPSSLYNVLAWTIDSDSTKSVPCDGGKVTIENETVKRQVLSVAQDVLYCARRGRVKTPKYVLLPLTVQHLTRSSQVVTILNRFGHGISYSQVEELDTALAEEILAREEDVPLPSHIDRSVSVVFAADNNDLLKETPTGANTTHCTNSIVVQSSTASVRLPQQPAKRVGKSHRRSLANVHSKEVPHYNAGARKGPGDFSINLPLLEEVKHEISKRGCLRDFTWLLARLPVTISPALRSTGLQLVPPWSGFNAAITASETACEPNRLFTYHQCITY